MNPALPKKLDGTMNVFIYCKLIYQYKTQNLLIETLNNQKGRAG